jgi:alpha-mannosidase
VEAILNTAISSLLDSPDRTFVYADLAFFVKWWQELHEDSKANVRHLVQQGRFEFTNGGIVQHDEANSHYSGIVDQMSLGMRFLEAEFGQAPRIAWQVCTQFALSQNLITNTMTAPRLRHVPAGQTLNNVT